MNAVGTIIDDTNKNITEVVFADSIYDTAMDGASSPTISSRKSPTPAPLPVPTSSPPMPLSKQLKT